MREREKEKELALVVTSIVQLQRINYISVTIIFVCMSNQIFIACTQLLQSRYICTRIHVDRDKKYRVTRAHSLYVTRLSKCFKYLDTHGDS